MQTNRLASDILRVIVKQNNQHDTNKNHLKPLSYALLDEGRVSRGWTLRGYGSQRKVTIERGIQNKGKRTKIEEKVGGRYQAIVMSTSYAHFIYWRGPAETDE